MSLVRYPHEFTEELAAKAGLRVREFPYLLFLHNLFGWMKSGVFWKMGDAQTAEANEKSDLLQLMTSGAEQPTELQSFCILLCLTGQEIRVEK